MDFNNIKAANKNVPVVLGGILCAAVVVVVVEISKYTLVQPGAFQQL